MRAVVYRSYGPPSVLSLENVDDAHERSAPGRGELRVRVFAASLNPKDVLVRKGKYKLFTGHRFPKGLGYDYAGEVVACGRSAGFFANKDRVFGMIQTWDGGTCAEYITVRAEECARIPDSLGWEEAAAIPLAAQTALQALRDVAKVRLGTRVLIHGASGGVGTFAIQIAKALGAHVTAVSSSPNHDLCRTLGADETIDYQTSSPFAAARGYDTIFDVFGNRTFTEARRALHGRGTYVTTVPSRRTFLDIAKTLGAPQRARLVKVRSKGSDLAYLAMLAEQGRLRSIIHRVFDLHDVQAASTQIETKRTRGKVVLRIREMPSDRSAGTISAAQSP
ncbi:NAD(P)-dependent alcohol dehydrogenase [Pendulispora albinea]|uniref:NAD(P)-dependent alcohol dehydrogenase n=1 Tax=Pendulispora albinea TaxID=2741071 RepID=A0ABZ2LPL6_9BACT